MPICLFQAYLLHVRDQFPGYSWLENDHDPWKVLKSTNKEHSVRQSADDLQIWRRLVYRYSEQSGNLGMVVWFEDSHFSFLGIKEKQSTYEHITILQDWSLFLGFLPSHSLFAVPILSQVEIQMIRSSAVCCAIHPPFLVGDFLILPGWPIQKELHQTHHDSSDMFFSRKSKIFLWWL